MNRIEKKFLELKAKGQKAFVAFITAGDPDLKMTARLIPVLEKAGVDILELGVPFSDPMADGPVIQKSSERALKSKTNLAKIFQLVKKVRAESRMPILLMGYFNPILAFGVEKYFAAARASGVDGTLIVDLPPEEGREVRQAARQHGVSLIYLLAPTSDRERIGRVVRAGSGFVYYVSLTGITGAQLLGDLKRQAPLKILKQSSRLPVCVGFGIKTPAQAREASRLADGVVVGSALVSLLEKEKGARAVAKLASLSRRIARAVHAS